MVNTFIIADTAEECAKLLDFKRLGKQRVEAHQIINILEGKSTGGWTSHPIVKMWKNDLNLLKHYHNCCVNEWMKRGYKNNMNLYEDIDEISYPWWFTWKSLQISHICSLLRKDEEYYKKIFKLSKDEEKFMDFGYIWIEDDQSVSRKSKKRELIIRTELTTEYCSDIGTGAPPQYRYTKEEAELWNKNKLKNPKTNRSIKESGQIYKDLSKAFDYYNNI